MRVEELRTLVRKLPTLPHDTFWNMKRNEIRTRILDPNDDPSKFLTWSVIIATMFVGNAPYIDKELTALQADNWIRWIPALSEDEFGEPERYIALPTTSGNMIHQAYHLLQWEKATGKRVKDIKRIVEFGGGYGAMAKLVRRSGFTGEYIIFDTPEFSLLQEFYLSNIGIDDVHCISTDHAWSVACKRPADLFIALWSLSETDNATQERIFKGINAHSVLVSGLRPHAEPTYFETLVMEDKRFSWSSQHIQHLLGNHYMIGVEIGPMTASKKTAKKKAA